MEIDADEIKRIVRDKGISNNEAKRFLKFKKLEELIVMLDVDDDLKEIIVGIFELLEGAE